MTMGLVDDDGTPPPTHTHTDQTEGVANAAEVEMDLEETTEKDLVQLVEKSGSKEALTGLRL
jgi:hypothetical protein